VTRLVVARAGTDALAGTRVVSPAPREVWRDTLAADASAVATQTPEWLDCLCETRGYVDASRLYELPGGRRLVVPLAARVWNGVRISEESWPYGWGYGGALVAGGALTAAEARLVLADLARRPVLRAAIVPLPLAGGVWDTAATGLRVRRVPYLSQVIDLDGGFAAVWTKRYRHHVRNCVRKAGQSSLEIRRGHDAAAFEASALLYQQSVDRWAHQRGQPLWAAHWLARRRDRVAQFAAVAKALGPVCTIWSAYKDAEPVAVFGVLQSGEHSIGWFSAMNRELARETRATYLLQSLAIEDACQTGARYFHMGESDPGSGVERHKSQFGAAPVRYDALRFERLPLTPAQRLLRTAAQRAFHRPEGGR
jgi:hypothetical protein